MPLLQQQHPGRTPAADFLRQLWCSALVCLQWGSFELARTWGDLTLVECLKGAVALSLGYTGSMLPLRVRWRSVLIMLARVVRSRSSEYWNERANATLPRHCARHRFGIVVDCCDRVTCTLLRNAPRAVVISVTYISRALLLYINKHPSHACSAPTPAIFPLTMLKSLVIATPLLRGCVRGLH